MAWTGISMRAVLALGLAGAVAWPAVPLAALEEAAAEAVAAPRWDGAPPLIPTEIFSQVSPYGSAKVSPDGKQLALSVTIEDSTYIRVLDIDTSETTSIMKVDDEFDLRWFRWAGNRRVLMSLYGIDEIRGYELPYTRLFVLDLDTRQFRFVGGRRMGVVGDDVLHVDPDGEWVLLAMSRNIFEEPEVWRLPLDGSEVDDDNAKIQRKIADVWDWYADDEGVVRLGFGWANRRLKVWYRSNAEEKFELVARLKEDSEEEELWDVLRLIGGTDEGLMLDEDDNGRVGLYRFNYATRERGELVFANADWDLTDYSLDLEGEPNAVYFTDDRDRIVWLDEDMAKIQASLESALDGKELWITSRARDDSRMMVWSGGPADPGVYYIYTPAKRNLALLAEMRPGLHPSVLAEVKPITYTARDGTKIRSYLTLPSGREPKDLPLVILPHGGPYGIRDKLDYADEVQLLANRGYAVLQPNFRGSEGYGEDFAKLGDGQIGRAMQDDLDDAMDWAVAEGIADPARVCLVGSSYGGYAALWGVIRNPERYRCGVSFAGVTDFDKQVSFTQDFLTRKGRREWQERVRGTDDDVDMGAFSPARQVARLTRPILLVHGEKDGTVPFDQFKRMQRAIEREPGKEGLAEYLTLEKSGHGFASPEDEQAYYDALVRFLEKHNPPL